MNPIDNAIVRLAGALNARRDAKLADQAIALNNELTRIETSCLSRDARELAMADLCKRFPRAAVAAIADVRGFGNLARIARTSARDELTA